MTPEPQGASAPGIVARGRRRFARRSRGMVANWGRVVGAGWFVFWLIMLVPTFLAAASRDTTQGRIGTAALVVGAVSYAVGGYSGFAAAARNTHRRPAYVGAVVTALATVVAVLTLGADGLDLLPYAGVTVVCALPLLVALPLVAVVNVVVALVVMPPLGANAGALWGGAVAALGTAMGIFSMQRDVAARRYAEEAHELALSDERNRMARDLHDILGHSLTVISLKADLAGKLVDRDAEAAKRELAELQSLARSALADVRATVNNYREVSLSGELVRARGALADAGIAADLPSTVDDVDPDLRELFAWALREATTNIVRHSGASRCTVTLDRDRLTVTDDGRGAGGPTDGNGLDGLRERARRVGALVETGPATGPASGLDGRAGVHPTDRPGFTLVVREAT